VGNSPIGLFFGKVGLGAPFLSAVAAVTVDPDVVAVCDQAGPSQVGRGVISITIPTAIDAKIIGSSLLHLFAYAENVSVIPPQFPVFLSCIKRFLLVLFFHGIVSS
jgi:hypothetical protein